MKNFNKENNFNNINNVSIGFYNLIDKGDRYLSRKIGPSIDKIANFTKNNLIKILIVAVPVSYLGPKVGYEIKRNLKNTDKIEKEIKIREEQLNHRDNKDYFNKNFQKYIDTSYIDKGIVLIRDVGMSFYLVKDGDNLFSIKNKLSKLDEFSYLKENSYRVPKENDRRNTKGFNILSGDLKPGMEIPIPIRIENRQINLSSFKQYSKESIRRISDNKHYKHKMKELLSKINEDELINIMAAFARSESANCHKDFYDNIGNLALHRWEDKYKTFSISFYHILLEKNADGKSFGPGLRGLNKLGLTYGQCYHPVNAGMLFLAYRFEKTNYYNNLFDYIPIKEENHIKTGKKYNGESSYGKKLYKNLIYMRNFGKIAAEGKDSKGRNIFSFVCDSNKVGSEIIDTFKKENPGADNIILTNYRGMPYDDSTLFLEGKKIFIKIN